MLSRTDDHESVIRLLCGSVGQFGLGLSRERDGDEVVYSNGLKVMLIGNELMGLLDGVTFDVNNDGSRREFVMAKK